MTTSHIIDFDLESLILEACEHLDPYHKGTCWPDPIEWDGRPLDEQARDLCVLLVSLAEDGDEKAVYIAARLRAALESV